MQDGRAIHTRVGSARYSFIAEALQEQSQKIGSIEARALQIGFESAHARMDALGESSASSDGAPDEGHVLADGCAGVPA